MKKWILPLLLMTPTLSQAYTSPAVLKATDVNYLNPDHVVTNPLKVKAMEIKGFSGTSLTKLNTAFSVLEKVVNSAEFKERVINFKNSKGVRAFASNDGLTNEEIFEKFMEGRETLQPNTGGEMNFYLKLYNGWWSRVVGYTSGTTNRININWKFFKKYKANEVAGNLAHEWVHKLGFGHKSAAEHDSAPYAIGYIVEELAAKALTSPTQKASQQ